MGSVATWEDEVRVGDLVSPVAHSVLWNVATRDKQRGCRHHFHIEFHYPRL